MSQNVAPNDERAEFIEGLRQIATFLEEHPEVELPYLGAASTGKFESAMHIYLVSPDGQRDDLATIARAMGSFEKNADAHGFRVFRRFAGIALVAQARRAEVCERIVVGTETVTEKVPDPEALAAVPTVEVEKTVEKVEWHCTPLLAAGVTE